mmetsp:Transcript_2106/g.6189  ORF Transcript_2106/g.6189 Transcript_2106/m.6189 type:complete len:200 (+) Transcript_2106:286-885(+)
MRKCRLMSASSLPLRLTMFGCARTRRMRLTDRGRASERDRLASSGIRFRRGPKSSCSQPRRFLPRIWLSWCTSTQEVISASKPASWEASAASSASSACEGAEEDEEGEARASGEGSNGRRYSELDRLFTSKDTGTGPPGVPCVDEAAWAMKSQRAFKVPGGCRPTSSSWPSARYFVSKVCGKSCSHEDLNSEMFSGRSS